MAGLEWAFLAYLLIFEIFMTATCIVLFLPVRTRTTSSTKVNLVLYAGKTCFDLGMSTLRPEKDETDNDGRQEGSETRKNITYFIK